MPEHTHGSRAGEPQSAADIERCNDMHERAAAACEDAAARATGNRLLQLALLHSAGAHRAFVRRAGHEPTKSDPSSAHDEV